MAQVTPANINKTVPQINAELRDNHCVHIYMLETNS